MELECVAGLQRTMKAAAGGTELWADSFLTPRLPSLLPQPQFPELPGVSGRGLWLC